MTISNLNYTKHFKSCPICDGKDIHIPINMQNGELVFRSTQEKGYVIPVNFVKCRQCGYIMLFTEAE